MRFKISQLSLDKGLRSRAEGMVREANLPSEVPWPLTEEDRLFPHRGIRYRMRTGRFPIEKDGKAWLVSGGTTLSSVGVRWSVTFGLSGELVATAGIVGTVEEGSERELLEALGCGPRVLGTIGPLVPLFPPDEGSFSLRCEELGLQGLPTLLVSAERVQQVRADLFGQLVPGDSLISDGDRAAWQV